MEEQFLNALIPQNTGLKIIILKGDESLDIKVGEF